MNSTDPREQRPPEDLEARVVARLRDAGLLAPARTTQETSMKAIHLRWGVAAAVLLAAGVLTGTQLPRAEQAGPDTTADAAAPDTRPAFALMLYEDARYQAPGGEGEHAARVAEYSAWARKLAGDGNLVDGAELLDGGVLMHRDRPRRDGVPSGEEGRLAGYFVIRAASIEEAERIAADCPHLAYGGTVSLRPTGA
jgi:hypothetical protein